MENQLSIIEKDIECLINKNIEIIKRIEERKSINKTEITKYFYEIASPELNCKTNDREPYTLSVKEEIETSNISDFITNWIIPSTEEKPIDVDPAKTLYGTNHDLMNSKCEDFDDLIRWNKQEIVCKQYLTLLRESISMKFGLIFRKNFGIVQNLLELLESELKEDEESHSDEIEVKIKDINKQISNLFEIKGVLNLYSNSKIPSTILTEEMMKSIGKMLPKKKLKFVLIHDQTKGKTAGDFDKAVKGVGPTLTVIKSTTGYVFGAYVHDTFGTAGGWIKGSEENFIFTLKNNNTPVKLLSNGGNGVHITSCGLHLSGDLIAFCTYSCNPSVFNKIAPGYDTSLVVNNTLLAGASTYTPQHMEVFSVSSIR